MKKSYDKIFLLLLFVIGLLAAFSYGAYLDQDSEQEILFSNVKEYIMHTPGESALEKELTEANIVEISDSIEKDHGIAAYYPISICMWSLNSRNPYLGNVVWHLYTYLFIFLIGCRSLYHLGKEVFQSRKTASFVTLLFFFTPRIFAESHYNNKDMILLSLVFACFWCGWKLMKKCSVGNVIWFALCGAFAFNTKIIGAWFFGVIGIYILLNYIFTKRFTWKIFVGMCLCILIWFGVYILITPACWGNIAGFFEYLFLYAVNFERWNNYILFQGKMIHTEYTGIPHKYLPIMILLTIPVGILLLTLAGGIWLAAELLRKKGKIFFAIEGYVCVAAFSGFVPLAYAVLAQTPVYNGWRHFYFSYASMIICAGYCVSRLEQTIKGKRNRKIMQWCGNIYIALLVIGIGINHPQEHSYYNWLAGNDLENSYELDYWDMSVWQAYNMIEDDSADEETLSVSALNIYTMWGLEVNWDILPHSKKEKITITEEWKEASYVIVNTTYANMYNAEEYEVLKQEYSMIGDISSYGNVICEIYKRR